MTESKKDPYEVLGVTRSDSFADMKMAYRRLSRKCHPDCNPDDKVAEEKFKAASEAYATLKARHGPKVGPVDDYDMDSFDVYAAEVKSPHQVVLEDAISALNSAYSAFSNRVLQLPNLISKANHSYLQTDRAQFLRYGTTSATERFLKNIYQSAAAKENRARAEQINSEDFAVQKEARAVLDKYAGYDNDLVSDLFLRYIELQGQAGQYLYLKTETPAPPLLLTGMAGLTRTLQYHNDRIDEALDMICNPKKNDNQTYTPK